MTCFGKMPVISFDQMTKHTQFHRHPLVIFNINFLFRAHSNPLSLSLSFFHFETSEKQHTEKKFFT